MPWSLSSRRTRENRLIGEGRVGRRTVSRHVGLLKTILADTDRVPVLIFDEVDAGVGGAVAEVMGARLRDLSRHHQGVVSRIFPKSDRRPMPIIVVEKQVRQSAR